MLTFTTFYRESNPRLVCFPPHVGRRGDVWDVEFVRTGYCFLAVQDYPKRSGADGNGMDLPERTFARGYGRGWKAAGRAEVRYWLVRRVSRRHGRYRRSSL